MRCSSLPPSLGRLSSPFPEEKPQKVKGQQTHLRHGPECKLESCHENDDLVKQEARPQKQEGNQLRSTLPLDLTPVPNGLNQCCEHSFSLQRSPFELNSDYWNAVKQTPANYVIFQSSVVQRGFTFMTDRQALLLIGWAGLWAGSQAP